MPSYDYYCSTCDLTSEIVKPISRCSSPEHCSTCNNLLERRYSSSHQIMNASVQEAEFNYGLGCVVKNKNHRAELCKQRNLVEVGNEPPQNLHKYADQTKEDRRRARWERD